MFMYEDKIFFGCLLYFSSLLLFSCFIASDSSKQAKHICIRNTLAQNDTYSLFIMIVIMRISFV